MGKWIIHAYYWFLWNIGMPDMDGNYNTIYDRFPITYGLRNQKTRLGVLWYILVLITLFGSFYFVIWSWISLWLILSVPLLVFFVWLFIHVDITSDTGIFKPTGVVRRIGMNWRQYDT
jgi:hypothetical protein